MRIPPRSSLRWTCAALTAAALLAGTVEAGQVPSGAAATHPHPGFTAAGWGDVIANALSLSSSNQYQASQDPGSLYTVDRSIGARSVWTTRDSSGRPVTGEGVGVAVLDSGITAVPGLDGPGKVTAGPDLSIEENGAFAQQDTFGHGTFMAGIIAGRGTSAASTQLAGASANTQLGVAPDASLLSMKLATRDGSTDVSQVIAALDWVTEHPTLPSGARIRVINLSYGTDSTQSYLLDPLAAAAENAWKHGIVVVVSAGNEGASAAGLTDPATDPFVLAVGAADSGERIGGFGPSLAKVADFSSVGTSTRHPDLVAPGTSIVSLRDPGSYIDTTYPGGSVTGDSTDTLFRGSGTSQAAAVVSGAVALLLQAYPSLTPDQVKTALVASADPMLNSSTTAVGAGVIDIPAAMTVARTLLASPPLAALRYGASTQKFAASTGQGSIEAARGGSNLIDADGSVISGEVDVQGDTWDPQAWWAAASTLSSWSGGQWLGTTWSGDGWSPASGSAPTHWLSAPWTSTRWSDADWSSTRWSSTRWSSTRWSSTRWSSAGWN